MTTFGEQLRRHRTHRNLTQAQLAEAMAANNFPWHASTVSKAETNDRDCTIAELIRLAEILDTTPADMLTNRCPLCGN